MPARSPRGARWLGFRRIAPPWIALALLGLAVKAGAGGTPDHPGPLPWRTSGRLPFTVDAVTFPDSAGYALEVYVRIPPATLGAAAVDTFGVGRLLLHARLRSGYGERLHEHEQLITSMPGDSATGFGKVVVLRLPIRPGAQRLRVRLEDVNSRKRGIFYMGRQVTNAEEIEGEFQAAKPQMGRDLSDVEFVWDEVSGASGSAFRRDTVAFLPNPERLYGLYASELRGFFSARSGDDRPWRWVARIYDDAGRLMSESDSSAASSTRLHAAVRLDLSTLPAGGYDLEIKAWQEGDAGALSRRSRFSIAWRPESWTTNPADIEDAVHLLLTADREEDFVRLEPGERERFLEDFWKARDPTPGTPENQALEQFRQRLDYANRTYTRSGLQKGMFTDMGRVFIRYGQPDEVLHEVIPAGDQTLDQLLDELAATENRPAEDVRQHGLGGDMRPYEVWIYEGVIPTPLEADPRNKGAVRHRKLLFLFVDQQGLGQYTLRYSTE